MSTNMKPIVFYLAVYYPLCVLPKSISFPTKKSSWSLQQPKAKKLTIALDANEKTWYTDMVRQQLQPQNFQKNKDQSWELFQFSWFLRGGENENEGMGVNYLYFDNGRYKYIVFQEYLTTDQKTCYGIKVIHTETQEETIIKAVPASVKGFLNIFREPKKIRA